MYKLILVFIVMFSLQASAEQACTIEYLGRDSEHAAEGEPSVDLGTNRFPFRRLNEAYADPNVFRWVFPSLSIPAIGSGLPLDVFEVTCVDE